MEQTNHNYPKFEAGQVLTSKALNDYFGYLEEQQRLTRTQLLGVGIINGLEFKFEGNALIITKGTAVTADGYLIDLPEDTSYTLAYKYDKTSNMLAKQNPLTGKTDAGFDEVLDKVEYVLYKDENDATLHNLIIDEKKYIPQYTPNANPYFFALMVDFISKNAITKCSELSCDIVQSNFEIEIRPVLIKKELLGENKLSIHHNTYSYKTINLQEKIKGNDYINIYDSINKNSYCLSGNTYNEFFQAIIYWLTGATKDGWTNQELYSSVSSLINRKTSLQQLLNNINGDRFDNLLTHIKSFKKPKNPVPGYYIQHLFNLETAIEEFFDYYNEFVDKYKFIPTGDTSFKRIVILGKEKCSSENEYRQCNDNILRNPQFIAARSLVEKALNRIFLLAESFNPDYKSNGKYGSNLNIFTYLKPNAKLGEKKMPEYYGQQLTNNDWRLDSDVNNSNTFEVAGSVVAENYFGLKKSTFALEIERIKCIYNIPIIVEYIPVGNINYIIDKYKKYYSKDTLYEVLFNFNDTRYVNFNNYNYNNDGYYLDNYLVPILNKIDTHSSFSETDARKSFDWLNRIMESYSSLDENVLSTLFYNLYENCETSYNHYYKQKQYVQCVLDYYLKNKDQSELFKTKWTETEFLRFKHIANIISENRYVSNSSLSNSDTKRKVLMYCLEYLRFYAYCNPIQIGGCPYDGKLTVFYTSDDEEKVLFVVGSYKDKHINDNNGWWE